MARPCKQLKSDDYQQIEDWASLGVSEKDIARQLSVSPTTWREIKRRDPRAAQALEQGRGREETALVGALFDAALSGSVTAAIFLLKARHKYVDNPRPEPPDSRVSINFQIPAALDPDQYKQVIDITPKLEAADAG